MSDVSVTGSPNYRWVVYVLECEWTRASDIYDDAWKHAAAAATKRVYVGSTNDLGRRLEEHNERTGYNVSDSLTDGSLFTQEYPPKEILELHFVKTESEARYTEKQLAKDLRKSHPGWFVWQS